MGLIKVAAIFLLLISVGAGARAQDAPTSATSAIAGTVVDAVTRQPLRSAQVRVRSFVIGQGAGRMLSASTDAEGRFSFEAVTPGRYAISATRDGYVGSKRVGGGSGGRLLNVGPDQHVSDVLVQLVPGATITGQIKNGNGKPLSGMSIEALRYFYGGGQKQLHGVSAPVTTNAAGEYRITAVPPGRYFLRAVPATTGEKSAQREAYAPTYYPANRDLARSTALTMRPGEELSGIDVSLTPVRIVAVTGRVLNGLTSNPASGAEVTLIEDEDGAGSSTRQAETDAKGNFEIQGVPAGNYLLMAQIESHTLQGHTLWGRKALRVSATKAAAAKVEIRIGPGADINGRIHLDDKAQQVDLSRITGSLQLEENSPGSALVPGVDSASIRADGTFNVTDVPEGTYWLSLSPLPPGYYLKGAGSLDVLESGITVAHGQSMVELDLTLSPNAARLEGTVSNGDQPAPGASVVLVPEGRRSEQPLYYKQSVSDQSGRFTIRNIAPGDYKLFAFEDVERGAYLNPEFLQQYEDHAETVHLQEGGYVSLQLDLIPAGDPE